MNEFDTIDCLERKGIIPDGDNLRRILATLPYSESSLYKLYFGLKDIKSQPSSSSSSSSGPAITITGIGYPGEELESNLPGQWYLNGSPIAGETGDTYTPGYTDIEPGDEIYMIIGSSQSNIITVEDYDVDAEDYIDRVLLVSDWGTTDAQRNNNRWRVSELFAQCKNDPSPFGGVSNFSALKASCLMAGPTTLEGALVPLVSGMPAPTNFNFVSGDYNRLTGLKGDGSSKYLRLARNNNADPQDNAHQSVFLTEDIPTASMSHWALGADGSLTNGTSAIIRGATSITFRSRSSTGNSRAAAIGFIGHSRFNSAGYVSRIGGVSTNPVRESQTPESTTNGISVFGKTGSPQLYYAARISFLSVGESVDLPAMDAALSTYMTNLI